MVKKQTKEIIKKESKALIRKYTPEEVRKILKRNPVVYSPELLLKELGEDLLPIHFDGTAKEKSKTREILTQKYSQALMATEFDSNMALVYGVPEDYRPMAMQLFREFVEEYECKTSSEKAIVEVMVNSYSKIMVYSRKFLGCVEGGEYLSDARTRYLAMMSKELDRAHRQFNIALMTLKQIKSPVFDINVKAKTAFIAQNQQINADKPNIQENENIEPK